VVLGLDLEGGVGQVVPFPQQGAGLVENPVGVGTARVIPMPPTSVSMWPESDSNAREPVATAAVAWTTKETRSRTKTRTSVRR
jgi:hypothetical protein